MKNSNDEHNAYIRFQYRLARTHFNFYISLQLGHSFLLLNVLGVQRLLSDLKLYSLMLSSGKWYKASVRW